MLELHGCPIDHDDAVRLYDALYTEGSPASRETAEAIRWGSIYGVAAELEPDMRAALLRVVSVSASNRLT